jgi:hypothetical protein
MPNAGGSTKLTNSATTGQTRKKGHQLVPSGESRNQASFDAMLGECGVSGSHTPPSKPWVRLEWMREAYRLTRKDGALDPSLRKLRQRRRRPSSAPAGTRLSIQRIISCPRVWLSGGISGSLGDGVSLSSLSEDGLRLYPRPPETRNGRVTTIVLPPVFPANTPPPGGSFPSRAAPTAMINP